MLAVLRWWLAVELLGWGIFPLIRRVFPRLRDQGLGLSRAFGLLLGGYLFWIYTSAGVARNDLGGAIAAVLAVLVAGAWAFVRDRGEILEWLRRRVRLVVAAELVFLLSFALWALVRSANPEILGTEKPMELAFLNGILRSSTLPPRDPWFSGHSISYYYFGYVLLAWLTRLTGVLSGVAFNLGNALWFALAAVGAWSLLFNLLPDRSPTIGIGPALLGPVFLVILANLEGPLDVLHGLHVGWRAGPDGTPTSTFWSWLGLKDLADPPTVPPAFQPSRHFWWWRASRVIHDVNLAGMDVEVIDEFPFFSFLLADNHPHLLALPFVILALGYCLQVFRQGARTDQRLGSASPDTLGKARMVAIAAVVALAVAAAARLSAGGGSPTDAFLTFVAVVGLGVPSVYGLASVLLGDWPVALTRGELLTAAWMFGGLAFLNTWDFPIYTALLLGVLAWGLRSMPGSAILGRVLTTGLVLGLAAVALYGFWYVGFASQASGVLPNIAFPSRLVQFLIMFGTLLTPIVVWLVRETVRRRPFPMRLFLGVGLGMPLLLFGASALVAALAFSLYLRNPLELEAALSKLGAPSTQAALDLSLDRRLSHSLTALFLGGILGLCAVSLRQEARSSTGAETPRPLLTMMIALGALLVLTPEFLYLKDTFGDRMNTVFKFYFAAWIVWSLAAAWAAWDLRPRTGRPGELLRLLAYVPVAFGLLYPVLALRTKTNEFQPPSGLTLDGTAHLALDQAEDYEAISWMNANLGDGIVVEAVGGSYSSFGRVSAHTGFPTVLGWTFHEIQWGRDGGEVVQRETDVRTLYETRDWTEALQILTQYGVDYVYVGPLERMAYPPLFRTKFDIYLLPVYQTDQVTIFAFPQASSEAEWTAARR